MTTLSIISKPSHKTQKDLVLDRCKISGDSSLCNYTTVQLFNRKDHVPVLSPYYVAVLNGEFLEIPWLNVTVILRMRMREDERCKVYGL